MKRSDRDLGNAAEAVKEPVEEAVVAAGRRAGKPLREIAVDLFGREAAEAGWHEAGWMRAKLRRLARRAEAGPGGGPDGGGPDGGGPDGDGPGGAEAGGSP